MALLSSGGNRSSSKSLQLVLTALALYFSPIVAKAEHITWSYTFLTGEVGYGSFDAERGAMYFENITNMSFDSFVTKEGLQTQAYSANDNLGPQIIRTDGSTDELRISFVHYGNPLFTYRLDLGLSGIHLRTTSTYGYENYEGPESWMLYPGTKDNSFSAPARVSRFEQGSAGWTLDVVPDVGSTVSMLGAALLSLAALRRRFAA